MTTTQRAALLAFLAGSASAMTGSALLRETPGVKSYFVHHLEVNQAINPDGGASEVSARVHATSTLTLADGGAGVVRLGAVECPLTEARKTSLRAILAAAEQCAANAP